MRRWMVVGLVIGLLGVAAPTAPLAQAAAPPAAKSTSPRSEALVRRYLKAIHFEQLIDTMMGSMLPLMSEQMSRQYPSITPEQRAMISGIVRDAMRESFTPKMIERMTPIYAQTFSESELEAIVTFYESPVGQAVVEKTPSLAPKSAEVARQLMPDIQKEVTTRLCAKIDCLQTAQPAPKPKAS